MEKGIMTIEDMYKHEIRQLNEQLYNAYTRIKELNEQLAEQKKNNGKD